MGFWVGTYRLNFCHLFLKLFWKIEKLIIFMGLLFFSFGAWEQMLSPNKLKIGDERQQKRNQNLN